MQIGILRSMDFPCFGCVLSSSSDFYPRTIIQLAIKRGRLQTKGLHDDASVGLENTPSTGTGIIMSKRNL